MKSVAAPAQAVGTGWASNGAIVGGDLPEVGDDPEALLEEEVLPVSWTS